MDNLAEIKRAANLKVDEVLKEILIGMPKKSTIVQKVNEVKKVDEKIRKLDRVMLKELIEISGK